jgi:hypothetical protein
VRSKSKWKRALLGLILGTIAFPSVYLPSTDTTAARFRLWGLTMGMTKDLIKLNDTNHVFVKLTETLPGYSWPDIGWLTYMITKVNILRKNR